MNSARPQLPARSSLLPCSEELPVPQAFRKPDPANQLRILQFDFEGSLASPPVRISAISLRCASESSRCAWRYCNSACLTLLCVAPSSQIGMFKVTEPEEPRLWILWLSITLFVESSVDIRRNSQASVKASSLLFAPETPYFVPFLNTRQRHTQDLGCLERLILNFFQGWQRNVSVEVVANFKVLIEVWENECSQIQFGSQEFELGFLLLPGQSRICNSARSSRRNALPHRLFKLPVNLKNSSPRSLCNFHLALCGSDSEVVLHRPSQQDLKCGSFQRARAMAAAAAAPL